MEINSEKGAVLILTLILLSVSIIFITAMNRIIYNDTNRFESDKKLEKAKKLARAGLEEELNNLEAGEITLGSTASNLGAGSYQTTVEINNQGQLLISSQGIVDGRNKKLAVKKEMPVLMNDYNNFAEFNNWVNPNQEPKNISLNNKTGPWQYFGVTGGNGNNGGGRPDHAGPPEGGGPPDHAGPPNGGGPPGNNSGNSIWGYNSGEQYLYTKKEPSVISGMYNSNDIALQDYEIEVEMRNNNDDNDKMGFVFRYQDEDNYYLFSWERKVDYIFIFKIEYHEIAIYKKTSSSGLSELVADNDYFFDFQPNDKYSLASWTNIKIRAEGNNLKVYFNDNPTPVLEANDSDLESGSYGPMADGLKDARFRNLEVTPLNVGENTEVVDDNSAVNNSALELINEQTYYKDSNSNYDPSKIYRVSARVKQEQDPNSGGQKCFLGVQGLDINEQAIDNYYVAANDVSLQASDGWQTFVGYFTGADNVPTGINPTILDSAVESFRPVFKVNSTNGDGTVRIDYIKIEQLEINKN
ncbi:hypothetical protein [Halanaerobacter jeridensis]|uniref:Uncharacterized protein n=1 Tax=Halanaerobacter jeridensis TaxID=706427 RepID=A0A939BPK5_9FIRM|nr:hypothetical protein [Halanaerobacter jeridensis]